MYSISGKARITSESSSGQVVEYPESFNFIVGIVFDATKQAGAYLNQRATANDEAVLVVEIENITINRLSEPHDVVEQCITNEQ